MKNKRDVGETADAALPFVSVVTPTWNRRSFLPYLLYMFQYQDYPAARRELIVLDDSEHSNADLVEGMKKYAACPELIRYYHQPRRMTLGEKRNRLNALATGEYIICMDDDDYYPADKIRYTVTEMRRHRATFAGCDSIPIWYSHIDRIYRSHAFGDRYALNGTFAYHRSLLKTHRYDDRAQLAEEKSFLRDFSTPSCNCRRSAAFCASRTVRIPLIKILFSAAACATRGVLKTTLPTRISGVSISACARHRSPHGLTGPSSAG